MSIVRAKLLRDICVDMSLEGRAEWIKPETLSRMFELSEQFEAEFEGKIAYDPEVRACYGEILSLTSNIAAQTVNLNIELRSILERSHDEETSAGVRDRLPTSSAKASTEIPKEVIKRSQEEGMGDGVRGHFLTSSAIASSEPPEAPKEAPREVIKVAVEKLPALKARAEPFLFLECSYEEREGFLDCYRDVLAAVYWAKRDDNEEGGFWPSPLSDEEKAELIAFRDSLDARIDSANSSDDVAAISSLLLVTTYAEWDTSHEIYDRFSERLMRRLDRFETISPYHSSRVVKYFGNYLNGLHRKANSGKGGEDTLPGIALIDRILSRILDIVDVSLLEDERLAQTYVGGVFDLIGRRCAPVLHNVLPFQTEIALKSLKQAQLFSEYHTISKDTLLGLCLFLNSLPPSRKDWTEEQADCQSIAIDYLNKVIDAGRIKGHAFRRPSFRNLPFITSFLIFRSNPENFHLDDQRIRSLIDLFERQIGEKARDAIAAEMARIGGWGNHWPIEPLADYLASLRSDGRKPPNLMEATLSLWAKLLMVDAQDQVLEAVTNFLPEQQTSGDADELTQATLAYRGIVLLASGFTPTETLLGDITAKLRSQAPLSLEGIAELYLSGLDRLEAKTVADDYNDALSAATAAVARLDILNGGDPEIWAQFETATQEQT